jgi:hypothetical protein
MDKENLTEDITLTDKELTKSDPEFEAKRRRRLRDRSVGSPHDCGSTIFWQYFRKKDKQLTWYCYRCRPPFNASAIIAIYNDGTILEQHDALNYYQKDPTFPASRRRARKSREKS